MDAERNNFLSLECSYFGVIHASKHNYTCFMQCPSFFPYIHSLGACPDCVLHRLLLSSFSDLPVQVCPHTLHGIFLHEVSLLSAGRIYTRGIRIIAKSSIVRSGESWTKHFASRDRSDRCIGMPSCLEDSSTITIVRCGAGNMFLLTA